jgi:hypothetical protein
MIYSQSKTSIQRSPRVVKVSHTWFVAGKARLFMLIQDPTLFGGDLRPSDGFDQFRASKFDQDPARTFSAIAYTVDWIATPVVRGITLASTTRTLVSP